MDKDQLNGLLALKLVADKRNFSAAAVELGISAPAISKIIKHLESRLGVTLLSRTTRSTSLTEAGEHFLAQAGPALDTLLNAIANVSSHAARPAGLLRINLPRLIYRRTIAPIVASFTRKYPDISVELFFEDAPSDVVAKGFDAGIRVSDILAQDMVAIKLYGPVRWVVAGSPKYLDRVGRPKHPKDLLAHNCTRVRVADWAYDDWEFEQKGKPIHVHVKGSVIFNDALVALDAVVAGQGLMYASDDAVQDYVNAGKLETILDSFAPVSAGYYLYYPQRSQVQPKLRAFIDHVKQSLKTVRA